VGVTGVIMLWLLGNPTVEQSLLSPPEVDQLVDNDFEGYYSEYAASHFAAQVWINNAWVSAQAIALGILGLPVVYVLFQNVLNLAIIGSIMINNDRGALFWGLILPHGLLELTAVFVAGGVGIRLFWSWIEPGRLSRTASIAREGRTAVTIALGLIVVLALSGVIEGFVTPSSLPTWARISIGVLAEAVFFAYVFVLGRRAVHQGHSGDLSGDLLEDAVATQA
uniref:stage II sporulation protein M n=1 Tax=Nocardioides sp. TaxID=35761 RepID=UPI002B26623E